MPKIQLSGNESDVRAVADEIKQRFGENSVTIKPITHVSSAALTARPIQGQNPYAEIIIQIAEGLVIATIVEFAKSRIGRRKISVTIKDEEDQKFADD